MEKSWKLFAAWVTPWILYRKDTVSCEANTIKVLVVVSYADWYITSSNRIKYVSFQINHNFSGNSNRPLARGKLPENGRRTQKREEKKSSKRYGFSESLILIFFKFSRWSSDIRYLVELLGTYLSTVTIGNSQVFVITEKFHLPECFWTIM